MPTPCGDGAWPVCEPEVDCRATRDHLCLSARVKRHIIQLPDALARRQIPWSSRTRVGNGKPVIARRTLLVAGATLSVLPLRRAFSQLSESLKIGFLTVLTGPLAAGGKQQIEGAAFYLKERGGMIAGRKVELITQDTTGSPAVARNKTQELVELHKVPVRRQSIRSAPGGTPPASLRRTTRNSSPASTQTINTIPVFTPPVLTRRFSS
jgi:Periplasmic binding protein